MSAFGGCVVSDHTDSAALLSGLTSGLTHPTASPARTWQGPNVAFTHRQSIVCPEDPLECQPRVHDDGQLVVLFDGRLDNRAELITLLSLAPHPVLPDSALVAAAFQRWGAEAPGRLRGPFALAVWHAGARSLILSKDALGERPLYFYRSAHLLAFATMAGPLLRVSGAVPRVCLPHLVDSILGTPGDASASLFEDIRSVPAATTMVFEEGRAPRSIAHWSFDADRTIHFARDDDYVDAGREILDRAVSRCLRLTGPVVTTLSAGLDSAAVAATAARLHHPSPVVGITVVPDDAVPFYSFPGNLTNEASLAALTARMHPNLTARVVCGTPSLPTAADERRAIALGMLPRLGHASWFLPQVADARGLGAATILTGGSGNAAFSRSGAGGVTDLLRSGRIATVARHAAGLAADGSGSALRIFGSMAAKAWMPRLWEAARSRRRGGPDPLEHMLGLFNPAFTRTHRLAERLADEQPADDRARRQLAVARLQRQDGVVLSELLQGIELRRPLIDRDLIEFCFALPADQFIHRGTNRWLARRVLADRVPPEITGNRRRGRQQPEFLHRMGLGRQEILRDLDDFEHRPSTRALLNLPAMRRLAEAWPSDPAAAPFTRYLTVLDEGLVAGRFLRAVETNQF